MAKKRQSKKKQLEEKLENALFRALENGKATSYILDAGLAFLGCQAFGFSLPSALMGPIALRLAQTPGGGVVNAAQVSGIATLAFLGVASQGGLKYLAHQYELAWEQLSEDLKEKTGIPTIPVGQPFVYRPVGVR